MNDESKQVQISSLAISNGGNELLSARAIALPTSSVTALVGSSGSGKTIAAYAILGLLEVAAPTLRMKREIKFPKVEGNFRISYLPQGTGSHLQPTVSVRSQIRNLVCGKDGLPPEQYDEADVLSLLKALRLPNPKQVLEMTPAELSGGMLQRILLAVALLRRPHFLVLDEPTTALDGYARAEAYKAILDCCKANGTAVLLLTHNPRDIAVLADRVLKIENGTVVPGPSPEAFRDKLPSPNLKAVGSVSENQTVLFTKELSVMLDPKKQFQPFAIRKKPVRDPFLIQPFTQELKAGDCLGLIGESGCGKTTLLRALSQLVNDTSGQIHLDQTDITLLPKRELRHHRKHFQIVFQDSSKSLIPFLSIRDLLCEPLVIHGQKPKNDFNLQADLERVLLPTDILDRQIGELSFGQRQRLAILRTLTSFPDLKLLMIDEPFASLDALAAQAIIDLWQEKASRLVTIIASHDIEWIDALCTHIHLMKDGQHIETCSDRNKGFTNSYAQTFWQAGMIADRMSLSRV